jgi:hypothetical protein
MPSEKAVEAMKRYSKDNSANLKQHVQDCVARLAAEGKRINITAVAREAGVSREFIHSHPDLHALVSAHKQTARPPKGAAEDAVAAGLRADRNTLIAKVAKQKAQIDKQAQRIADLERQRKLWLGSQLGKSLIDPEEHQELRVTNDRLMAENTALTQKVTELTRLNTILEADLRASREAHMEAVAAQDATGSISPMTRRGSA